MLKIILTWLATVAWFSCYRQDAEKSTDRNEHLMTMARLIRNTEMTPTRAARVRNAYGQIFNPTPAQRAEINSFVYTA